MGKGKRNSAKRKNGQSDKVLPLRRTEVYEQATFISGLIATSFARNIHGPRLEAFKREGLIAPTLESNYRQVGTYIADMKRYIRVRHYSEDRFSTADMHATYLYAAVKAILAKHIDFLSIYAATWIEHENRVYDDDLDESNCEMGFADFKEEVLIPEWVGNKESLLEHCTSAVCSAISHLYFEIFPTNSFDSATLAEVHADGAELELIQRECTYYTGGRFAALIVKLAMQIIFKLSDSWIFNLACAATVDKDCLVGEQTPEHIINFEKALLGVLTVALSDDSLGERIFFEGFQYVSQISADRQGLYMSHAQFDLLQMFGTRDGYSISALDSESQTVWKLIRNDINYVKALKKPYSNFFGYKHNFELINYLAPVYGYDVDDYKNMTSSADVDAAAFDENFEHIAAPFESDDALDALMEMASAMLPSLRRHKQSKVSAFNVRGHYDAAITKLLKEGRAIGTELSMAYLDSYQTSMRIDCGAGFTLDSVNALSDKHKTASAAVERLNKDNVELRAEVKRLEQELFSYRRKGTSDESLTKIAELEKKVQTLGTQNAKYKSRIASLNDQSNALYTMEQKYKRAELELLDARRQLEFMENATVDVVENESALSPWEIAQLAKLRVHLVVPDLMSYKDLARYMPKSEFKFVPNDRYVRLQIGTSYDIYFMSTKMTSHGYWWQWLKDLKAVPERRIDAHTVGKFTTARLILKKAKELGLIDLEPSTVSSKALVGALQAGLR